MTKAKQYDGIGFLLADVSRLIRHEFQRRIEGRRITHAQARALIYISRHEGIRQVELAELLDIQPITLARLIDQLAENYLVERRSDPNERRAPKLFLTSDAASHIAVIEDVAASIRTDALHGVGKKEADTLFSVLRKMRSNLSGS